MYCPALSVTVPFLARSLWHLGGWVRCSAWVLDGPWSRVTYMLTHRKLTLRNSSKSSTGYGIDIIRVHIAVFTCTYICFTSILCVCLNSFSVYTCCILSCGKDWISTGPTVAYCFKFLDRALSQGVASTVHVTCIVNIHVQVQCSEFVFRWP